MTQKYIEGGWQSYKQHVLPADAPDIQIKECRQAFYAGAAALFETLMMALDSGDEPTDADMLNWFSDLVEGAANALDGPILRWTVAPLIIGAGSICLMFAVIAVGGAAIFFLFAGPFVPVLFSAWFWVSPWWFAWAPILWLGMLGVMWRA